MRALRELRANGPPRTADSIRPSHPEYARAGETYSILYPDQQNAAPGPGQRKRPVIGSAMDDSRDGRRPVLTPYAAAAVAAARERRMRAVQEHAHAPDSAECGTHDVGQVSRRPHPEYDPGASAVASLLYPERPPARPLTRPSSPLGANPRCERRASGEALSASTCGASEVQLKRQSRHGEAPSGLRRGRSHAPELLDVVQPSSAALESALPAGVSGAFGASSASGASGASLEDISEPACSGRRARAAGAAAAGMQDEVLALRTQVAALTNLLSQGVVFELPLPGASSATTALLPPSAVRDQQPRPGTEKYHVWFGAQSPTDAERPTTAIFGSGAPACTSTGWRCRRVS